VKTRERKSGVLRVLGLKRDRLETLCGYLLRPPVSEMRLERKNNGNIVLRLKSQWSDGTYAMEFTPHEFIEKLIAIIPKPRIHKVRFKGSYSSATKRNQDHKKYLKKVKSWRP